MSFAYGFSQDSVLDPLLFLIYINDLGSIHNLGAKPKLFADDTNIFIYSRNVTELNIKCQLTVDKIFEWTLANKLSINFYKTCYILFSPSSNTITTTLILTFSR